MAALLISIAVAYLMGSIPTGFILARITGKTDIRKAGSGNVGATNVYRTSGKLAGIATLVIDIAKGALAVGLVGPYFRKWGVPIGLQNQQVLLALAAVSGHNWTPFLNFRGGKGIATSAGALLVLCPGILSIILLIWVGVFSATKIVSIASLAASVSFPIVAAFFGNISITLLSIILCIISVIKHRDNIRRLIRGEEKPLKLRK